MQSVRIKCRKNAHEDKKVNIDSREKKLVYNSHFYSRRNCSILHRNVNIMCLCFQKMSINQQLMDMLHILTYMKVSLFSLSYYKSLGPVVQN